MRKGISHKPLWLALAISMGMIGCAADGRYSQTQKGSAVGTVGGAAAGAAIGAAIDGGSGAGWGALAGAVAGGLTGSAVGYMNDQQREMEAALAEERRGHQLEIQRLQDESLKLDIPSEISFDHDSDVLKPAFLPTLDKIAEVLKKYNKTVVHVIGHTDSTGSEKYNLDLSLRRAGNVAVYFERKGVPSQRLSIYGRGESEPRASNATAAGRQLNRRVEIILKPILEGEEHKAFEAPVTSRSPYGEEFP
ncbi:OmpA/MotB [Nitrosococcus oceani ATCC 19707]|uniref:OmpA/MotB n=2 Tax=Nitrosococcus oceani TaxID=1229 RepID=Q3JCW0_NITOC|nr:OmpA family protein [Nitrosococcus oceani]ABA57336.1 OmpA/MotB [Nitrosococcus oceani ATCC 19707]EDZ67689.1 Rickettsia 17 kDa surface antigen family [Nitrosococcus oceani AFC27]KFI20312.1 flagellar motor protein MotB [Nitrosococcus oceani C-27]